MQETVVLFCGVGMGHLIPITQLAKTFVQSTNFSATILLVTTPFDNSKTITPFISTISTTHPSISFHHLPTTPSLPVPPSPNRSLIIFDLLRNSNPHILSFLTTLSQTTILRSLILDFFCTAAIDVAIKLNIPSYIIFPMSASVLATFLQLPTIHSNFKDLGDTKINFVDGLPPIPASHMPPVLQDRHDEAYQEFIFHVKRLRMADGIMINTVELLERNAVRALSNFQMPPVYCIGPVISGGRGRGEEKCECLTWLDKQPKGSVVFLCFGSLGTFSVEQLKEMAIGLERCGRRFLWVVQSPVDKDRPDLDALMLEGFLERTEGRGMVVKSWAPQAEVLSHEAVGGFVSHCGWNSVLEAVTAGVAIIAWPLYSEQKVNKVFLVEEMKLAVEMRGYDKEMVSAEEVENKIRWLMESEGGKELRDRAAAAKESAVAAWKVGGSSDMAWVEMVRRMKMVGVEDSTNSGSSLIL